MKDQIMKNKRFKIWKKIVTALSCVVVLCTTYALILPAITMENQAYCGLEEHTHGEECYSTQLICKLTDEVIEGHEHTEKCYEQQQRLICEIEENAGHTHTEACYEISEVLMCDLETEEHIEEHIHTEECYQRVFACEKEEHTHEKICYSDKTADVETAEEWEQTLPAELTGNGPEDLILVAKSQLGYKESERNYIITEDGNTEGYSRYGEWNGAPYDNWCKAFVAFCLNYAEIEEDILEQKGTDHIAALGDIICFDHEIAGYEHVAIVSEIGEADGWIKVIEGDVSGKVTQCTYDLTDVRIKGYLAFPETEEVIEEEIIIEETADSEIEELEDSSADSPIMMFAARNSSESSSDIELTGNWSADLAAVAAAEKGYTADSDGTSKYGEWYGDAAGDMSVLFPLWCLEQAGVNPSVVPVPEKTDSASTPDAKAWVQTLQESSYNLYQKRENSYFGKPGDIAVFHTNNWQGVFSHIGIVTEVMPNGQWDGSMKILRASQNGVQETTYTHKGYIGELIGFITLTDEYSATQAGILSATTTINKGQLPAAEELIVDLKDANESYHSLLREHLVPAGSQIQEDYYLEVYFKCSGEKIYPDSNIGLTIDFITPLNSNASTDESSGDLQWVYGVIDGVGNIRDVSSELEVQQDENLAITEILYNYQPETVLALASTQSVNTVLEAVVDNIKATAKSSVLNENMQLVVRVVEENTEDWDTKLKGIYETEKFINSVNKFIKIEIQNENGEKVSIPADAKVEIKLEFSPGLSSALEDGSVARSGEWKLNFLTNDSVGVQLQEVTSADGLSTDVSENVTLNSVSFPYKEKDAYALSAVIADPDCYEIIDSYEALVKVLLRGDSVSQIKLTANIIVPEGSSAIEISSGRHICLDLNGCDIAASSTLFNIRSGAEFTLLDSRKTEETTEEIAVMDLRADEDGDTEAELAANRANVGELADYNEDTETLIYYVTESRIVGPKTGETEEILVKHTVQLNGTIKGGDHPVFYVENGTFHMEGGAITNCTNSAVAQSGGTLNLTGGYICNNQKTSGSGGAIYSSGDATVIVDGAVIAANSAPLDGGAIWMNGTRLALTSGVISGNTAGASGGGIFCTGSTNVDISGGYITNNRAECLNVADSYRSGGGGIFTNEYANIYLKDGYITGNYAQSGGGGLRTFASQFRMTGGFVNSNYANESEGGGLSINEYGIGTILGGYINNNVSNTHQHWGGGGIFSANDTTLSIRNIIITENDAGGYGGGVAGCSTGRAFVYEEDGGAIYNNTAVARDSSNPHISGGESTKAEDHLYPNSVFRQYGYEDYFCAFNSIISGTMLGGGAANWTGTVDTIPVVVAKEEIVQSTYLMGLVANPTTAGISSAQQKARVYVNGNDSYTHGGGILGNGYLVIGKSDSVEVYSRLKIEALKELVGGELTEGQFEFVIENFNTGYEVAHGINDAEGNIVFDHMLPFSEEGTYEYLIYEKQTSDEKGAYEGILMDTTEYKLRVQVEKIVESLEVDEELRIEERSIIKYRYIITSIVVEKRNGGEWEVVQTVENPDNLDNKPVTLALTRGTTFHNVITDATKFSVMKKWVGNATPQAIWVQLIRDGEPYGNPVNLNSYNNWSYTWEEELPLYWIDENGEKQYYTYSVQERDALEGYTVEYDYFNTTEVKAVWIPYEGTELVRDDYYIIVSPNDDYILYVSNVDSDHTIAENDKATSPIQTETIVVGGKAYNKYFYDGLVSSESIYRAEYWDGSVRLNNPSADGRPLAIADESGGKVLKSSWWPLGQLYTGNTNICMKYDVSGKYMVVFENNKFDVVNYDTSNRNAAKLYTLTYTDPENKTIFTITNSKIDEDEITYKLDLTKISADNSEVLLAGAKFALYPADENGKADTSRQIVFVRKSAGTYQYLEIKDITSILTSDIVTAVTARGGKLIITDIPKGEYVLIETEAPNGYLVTEPVHISFENEKMVGQTYRMTLEDQLDKETGGYKLPDTGGTGTTVYTAGGILLLMISALLYIERKNRKKGGTDSS